MSMDALHADIIYWMGESAKYCRRQRTEQKIKEIHTWIAPSDDWLKINCDGSYITDTRHGGWGFVVRNANGEVRGVGAGRMDAVARAAHAEAEACSQALQLAASWSMMEVIIEADSANLIKALQSVEFDLAPEGVIYRDIRSFIGLNFSKLCFFFSAS
jgi:hypothetical protein